MMVASCWLLAVAALSGGDGLWFGPAASVGNSTPGNDVMVGGNAGIEIAVAPTGTPAPRPGGRAELAIYVVNRGAQPLDFGPAQLRLRSDAGDLRIVPFEQLVAELGLQAQRKRSEASQARSQAHASLPPTFFSGTLSNVGDYQAARLGSGGYSGSTRPNAADAARDNALRREIAPGREEVDSAESEARGTVESLALRQQILAPGQDGYGHVLFELPRRVAAPLPVTLVVEASGGPVEFALLLRPAAD
ncbi:MAG: hypothetical protein KAX84_07970 [Burkholderiales bacterium]|nr:hypothetical protein [Burkholderiales bacterium]HQX25809.1 hypothetical protein [Pseudomonadota bacterium]